jgi:glycosyltransferase involved in cell wall biosynthesis
MKISIVIPCYNDGLYLTEAVNSVIPYAGETAEVIIVNDGSTDRDTLNILDQYANQGIKVLSQSNTGLAHARNQGIKSACGDYILPLDADNKIKAGYIEKSIKLLDTGNCDIVYAKPSFIGEDISERKFTTHKFEGNRLLAYNYIDACAVYRKSLWKEIGGYDEKMPFQGNEDLNLSFLTRNYMSTG